MSDLNQSATLDSVGTLALAIVPASLVWCLAQMVRHLALDGTPAFAPRERIAQFGWFLAGCIAVSVICALLERS